MVHSLLAVTLVATASVAQQVPVPQMHASAQVASNVSRAITIDLTNVYLGEALTAIAAASKLYITYSPNLIPLSTVKTTVRAKNASVDEVLTQALAGTGVFAQVSADGRTIIVGLDAQRTAPQSQGIITGKIVHAKTKQPVVGASVTLDDATKGVLTDERGAFRISASAGSHRISARALGFARQTLPVTVTEESPTTIDVALEPSTSVLNEVVVTGTVVATERKAIPTPITVITAADIEKRGITRIDQLFRGEVPGMLAIEQGTQVYSSNPSFGGGLGAVASSKVYVRGSASLDGSANPIKTYVDGVELMDPNYLGTIDPKSIERIEIITGPQAATIYGSGAMGGVMQIFTKRGNGQSTPDITLNLRSGILETNLAEGLTPTHNHSLNIAGGAGPEFSYSGTLSYTYAGQWQPYTFNRNYAGQIGAVHVHGPVTVGVSASILTGSNGTSYFAPIASLKRTNGEWTPQAGIAVNARVLSNVGSQTAGLNLDYRPFSIWQHHMTIGKSENDFDLVPSSPRYETSGDTSMSFQSSIGRRTTASYNMTLTPARFGALSGTFTAGANGSTADNTSYSGNALSASASSLSNSSITGVLRSQSYGAFSSLQLGLSDHLYLTLGLRGEHNPSYGREHKIDWTPTNGLTYTVETGDLTVKLLGSYGRATRPPQTQYRLQTLSINSSYTPGSYVSQFAALGLTPEYSRGPQGGLELYYGNVGSLTVNRYKQTVTDLIQRVVLDSVLLTSVTNPLSFFYTQQYQYQNVGRVGQQGWEATGSLNLRSLTLKGTYSWNDSRVETVNPTASSQYKPGQSFYGLPTHSASGTMSYAHGGTSVSLVTNWVGEKLLAQSSSNLACYTIDRVLTYDPRRTSCTGDQAWPGYVKSDLAVSQFLTSWASATVNVTNLGNSYGSEVYFGSPSIGRQTLFGLSLRYPTHR